MPVEETSGLQAFMEDLLENFAAYLKMDVAASSQRTYDVGVRRYLRFCDRLGVALMPDHSCFGVCCGVCQGQLCTVHHPWQCGCHTALGGG